MKLGKLHRNSRTKYLNEPPHEVIQRTHHELLLEIQYKYPGLYNLSQKYGHDLLDEIAKIIFNRVKIIMGADVETRGNCFKLTSNYRKMYPHFRDFQLIQKTLYSLQDSRDEPRLHIQETELLQPVKPAISNIPYESLKAAYSKYSERILKVMSAHIKSLDSTIADGDTEEAIAKKKVREELKKMMPCMPTVLKQVVTKHIKPQRTHVLKIRIYGEPFLPPRDVMSPFVHRYHSGINRSRIIRHPRIYNLLMFKIPQDQYAELMAMDGTVINGAKLVIRRDSPTYAATAELRSEMSAAFGGPKNGVLTTVDIDELDSDGDVEMR